MISRRSFTALAGAALFGLFARIRFAPSAGGPRGRRVRRGGLITRDFGGFEFSLTDDRQLSCEYQGRPMRLEMQTGSRYRFGFVEGAMLARVEADLSQDDTIFVRDCCIYRKVGAPAIEPNWSEPETNDLIVVLQPDYFFRDPPNPARIGVFEGGSGEWASFHHSGDQLLG